MAQQQRRRYSSQRQRGPGVARQAQQQQKKHQPHSSTTQPRGAARPAAYLGQAARASARAAAPCPPRAAAPAAPQRAIPSPCPLTPCTAALPPSPDHLQKPPRLRGVARPGRAGGGGEGQAARGQATRGRARRSAQSPAQGSRGRAEAARWLEPVAGFCVQRRPPPKAGPSRGGKAQPPQQSSRLPCILWRHPLSQFVTHRCPAPSCASWLSRAAAPRPPPPPRCRPTPPLPQSRCAESTSRWHRHPACPLRVRRWAGAAARGVGMRGDGAAQGSGKNKSAGAPAVPAGSASTHSSHIEPWLKPDAGASTNRPSTPSSSHGKQGRGAPFSAPPSSSPSSASFLAAERWRFRGLPRAPAAREAAGGGSRLACRGKAQESPPGGRR